jgi:hypothetical protein
MRVSACDVTRARVTDAGSGSCGGRVRAPGQCASTAITSTSTAAPRGNVATPMVERAGYGSRK